MATNITGHCGYELPLWLHATVTAGVGLTPLAATSKTHYIHHLDPRFNKVRAALQRGCHVASEREDGGVLGCPRVNLGWTRGSKQACAAARKLLPTLQWSGSCGLCVMQLFFESYWAEKPTLIRL